MAHVENYALIACLRSKHDSPNYGKHYSAEEVAEIFAPSQSTVDTIQDWLVSAGIAAKSISQSVNKQWMQFDASTSELESLLKTEYHVYEHAETGKPVVACDEYVKFSTKVIQILTSIQISCSRSYSRACGLHHPRNQTSSSFA